VNKTACKISKVHWVHAYLRTTASSQNGSKQ